MKDFNDILLNQPTTKKIGYIYKSYSTDYDILITSLEFIKLGLVYGIVLTRVVEIGDENDVEINNLNEYLKKRKSMRLTKSFYPSDDLNLFVGEVDSETLVAIINSLDTKTSSYKKEQKNYINKIIDDLAKLREEAFELFDKSLVEESQVQNKVIGRIDFKVNNSPLVFGDYAFAASSTIEDINLRPNLLEFNVIEKENLFRIKFVKKTDENLYLEFNISDDLLNKLANCKIYDQELILLLDKNIELKENINYLKVAFEYRNYCDYKMILQLDDEEYEFILGL